MIMLLHCTVFRFPFYCQEDNSKFFQHFHRSSTEQNNKLFKIDSAAVSILDSPQALLKWSVAGPEITSMLKGIDKPLLYCFS